MKNKMLQAGIFAISLSLISGCSALNVKTEEVERTRLDLEGPDPVDLREVRWYVITESNADEVFKKLKNSDVDAVLFGLTDIGYENLSKNMLDIRGFLQQQGFVLRKYKEYYEGPKDPENSEEPKEDTE